MKEFMVTGRCTAPANGHRTAAAAMRCPYCASKFRYGRGGDVPTPLRTRTPTPGAFHAESGLPFNTGTKIKPRHHNVGQVCSFPVNADDGRWCDTWFEDVTFKAEWTPKKHNISDAVASGPSFVQALSHITMVDCVLDGIRRVEVGNGSVLRGIRVNNTEELHGPTVITLKTDNGRFDLPCRVSDVVGDDVVVDIQGAAQVANCSVASIKIASKGDVWLHNNVCEDWVHVASTGDVEMYVNAPGQGVMIGNPEYGAARGPVHVTEDGVPVLVVHSGDRFQNAERLRLTRRPPDNSEGPYLHPHNEAAWKWLVDSGSVVEHLVFEGDEDDEYEYDRNDPSNWYPTGASVSDDALAIAIALHTNP